MLASCRFLAAGEIYNSRAIPPFRTISLLRYKPQMLSRSSLQVCVDSSILCWQKCREQVDHLVCDLRMHVVGQLPPLGVYLKCLSDLDVKIRPAQPALIVVYPFSAIIRDGQQRCTGS